VILIPSLHPHRFIAAAGLVALVTACGGTDDDADAPLSAPTTESAAVTVDGEASTTTATTGVTPDLAPAPIATTTIWADITSAVLCGVPVTAIVPTGADPHTFEAPIAARADIAAAGFVVANGLDLEEGLLDLLETVEAEGVTVLHMTDHVEVLAPGDDDEHDDHSDEHDDHDHSDETTTDEHDDHDHSEETTTDEHDDHDHSAGDPHIWLDPMRVAAGIGAIVEAAVDAGHDAEAITACAEDYRSELTALDAEISELVASVPTTSRNLVTNHDALGYFADRYDFTVIGTVIPSTSTMAATNPADLADLAALIEESGVTTIFTDAESSDVDAAALAERLDGVRVTPLLTGSLTSGVEDGRDYVTLMRTNAERIVVGSGGSAG
jgi:zinc/manganese transport system substrate-binding protein